MFVFDLVKALGVRMVLLIHSLLIVWLASQTFTKWEYWLMCLSYLGMIVEAFVTICVNKAQEWKWICPCFFFYLVCTVPGIWIIELDHQKEYLQLKDNIHIEEDNSTSFLDDLTGMKMYKNTLVAIEEQLFLYLMVLSRWLLPRGEISRAALSQLLFVFISIASDITEFFTLFEEDEIKKSTRMMYIVLIIWTMSLLQFTFVLTSTNSPKKPRVVTSMGEETELEEDSKNCFRVFFQSEIWSITINFVLQDGPFLALRLYTMISLNVLTYSIIFFTAKNGLVVMLLFYRLSVVCCERETVKDNAAADLPEESSKPATDSNRSKEDIAN